MPEPILSEHAKDMRKGCLLRSGLLKSSWRPWIAGFHPRFENWKCDKKTHYYPDDFPKSICCTPTKCCGFGPTIGPVLVRTCEFHPQNRHHHGPPGPRRFGWDIMGYHGNVMGMLWILQMIKKPGKSCQSTICRFFWVVHQTVIGWSTQVGGVEMSMSGHDLRV